jgi:hypothetical protein
MSINRCHKCNEFIYNGNETLLGYQHKCAPVFLVYEPSNGTVEWKWAREIYAYEAEEAAEKFRDETDAENCEYPDEKEVWVKDSDGAVTKWHVGMESRPHYNATQIKEQQ